MGGRLKGSFDRHSVSDRFKALYALAQRHGGVSSTEAIAEFPRWFDGKSASTALQFMERSKRLEKRPVRERVNKGLVRARFFADPNVSLWDLEEKLAAETRAANAARRDARRAEVAAMKPRPNALRVVKQPQPRALQKPEGPVIVPAHVKVQRLPSAPVYSRHQLPPGERVVGGFASLGPGRYLDEARP